MRSLAISAIMLAAAAHAILCAAEDTGWRHERVEWNRPIPEARSISVINPMGDVRVRGWDSTEVNVIAHLQAQTPRPLPEVVFSEADGALRIEVTSSAESGRADLTIMAAPDCALILEGGDDLIEVKGMKSAVTASTGMGAIFVRVAGPATLSSTQGSIDLQLTQTGWQGATRVETTTGAIEVLLPWQPNVEVSMLSAGLIGTDFSATVEPTGAGVSKRAHAVVGAGGAEIELVSERGDISLRRSFVPSGIAGR